jgi:hypothetical protein
MLREPPHTRSCEDAIRITSRSSHDYSAELSTAWVNDDRKTDELVWLASCIVPH